MQEPTKLRRIPIAHQWLKSPLLAKTRDPSADLQQIVDVQFQSWPDSFSHSAVTEINLMIDDMARDKHFPSIGADSHNPSRHPQRNSRPRGALSRTSLRARPSLPSRQVHTSYQSWWEAIRDYVTARRTGRLGFQRQDTPTWDGRHVLDRQRTYIPAASLGVRLFPSALPISWFATNILL